MVPSTVTAGPPAETVVPAIEKNEGFGVNTWPAAVYALLGEASRGKYLKELEDRWYCYLFPMLQIDQG